MSAIKINGTWQRVSSIKIKQNGVWNDHTALYARLDGAWHLIDLAAEAQGPAYHVWKAYADDALGNGISLSPEGKKYIGFAVGQRTEEPDLSDPSLYDWSLIKGADGKDGQDVDPEVLNEILEKQNSYNSSLSDVNDDLAAVDQALADADSRLKAADTALNQALQTAQVNFSSSVDSLNESIGEVENDLLNLASLSSEQGSSITQLEGATDEQAQKISVLETNDGSSRSRLASLESTSDEQATRLSSLGVWDGEAFATIKSLEEADAENASLIRTLETRGEEADSKIATLESTSSSHASKLSTVETRSINAQNRAAALEETTRTHATRLTSVETKANDTESKVSTLEESSEGHASRLTNVETKATTGINKANAAQSTANSATTKANNAQSAADDAQELAETANSKVTAVTNRVSTLEETSEGHASRLSTVETMASSGVSKANAAQSTAYSATTKANNAQSTADSGVNKANAAQAKADSADSKVTAVTSRVSTLESTTETMATKVDEVSFSRANLVTRGVFGSNLSRGGWTAGSVVSTQAVGIPTLSGRPYVLKLTSRDCYDYNAKFPISVGDKIYISAWVYTTDTNVSLNIGFRQVLDGVEQSSWPTIIRESDRSGKWVYVEGTYTHTSSGYNGLAPFLQMGGSGTMPPAYISDIVYSRSSHSGALAAVTDESKAYVDQQTGELKAERVIKADANGKVSGIHLLAKGSGVDAGGKLYFQADEIAIVPPSWDPSTESNKTKFPFYFSEDRSFMYLDEAMIQKLSAETIDSGRLAVDGLTVLSNDISVPAGAIREHMIDPSFKDGIVRVNPDATIQGGTKSVSSTGIGQGKKITVPALESGGSAQTMTISVVGPNEVNRKDVQFDLEMKLNGAPYNFTSGESKIRLSSTITYSTEDGGTRMYRSSFKFEDQVILPAPTKGNEYTYEFIITNMSFSPANTSTYNFADKLKFSISVSEPTVSSGGFITDVRWDEVKEQPSFIALDTTGSSSYPRMFAGNNPASSSIWLRMPATNGGLLPYSNGNSLLGTSSWKFKEIHSVNFYENGTVLSSKYLGKTATATNASKLDGYSLTAAATADTVARRDGAADLSARLFRSTYGNQSDISGAIAFRKSTSDNYIRFCSNMASVRAFVDVYSKGEADGRYLNASGDSMTGTLNAKAINAVSTAEAPFRWQRSSNSQTGQDDNVTVHLDDSNIFFTHNNDADGDASGFHFRYTAADNPVTLLSFNSGGISYRGNTIWHAGNDGSGSGLDADMLDGLQSTSFARLGTTAPPDSYFYTYRGSVYPSIFVVQGETGDIARFIKGSRGTTEVSQGAVITNNGTVISTGQIIATGSALGTNQVAAIFRHPTQNTNLAIIAKNNANGAFRFEANTDGDLRIQTASTTGAYSASNGDAGTIARFYRNGKVEITGQLHAKGGLYHASGKVLVMGGTNTWYRAYGDNGLFFQDYGGGFHMKDSTWIRSYGGKQFYVDNGSSFDAIYTAGGIRYNKQLLSAHPTGEGGLVGNYDVLGSGTQQMIWTIGKSWSSHNNHYGLGYAYGNYLGTDRSEHFLYLKNNGVAGARLSLQGNAKFEGVVRAADLIATSDRRVKDNIKVISDALEKVSKLTGNTYTRNDLDDKPSAGVIAQEVQEVLPEAVTETEGRLQVAHNGVIGLLVEAVKELKAIVTMQEIEIKQLKGGN